MKQSGTTYPTVDDEDISSIYLLETEKQDLEKIETLQQKYIQQIEQKASLIKEIIALIDSFSIKQSKQM
jgi:hypothetical protein